MANECKGRFLLQSSPAVSGFNFVLRHLVYKVSTHTLNFHDQMCLFYTFHTKNSTGVKCIDRSLKTNEMMPASNKCGVFPIHTRVVPSPSLPSPPPLSSLVSLSHLCILCCCCCTICECEATPGIGPDTLIDLCIIWWDE